MVSSTSKKLSRAKPVLVYLVTEDWYFLSHRVPMASAALAASYDVHVITHVNEDGAAIEALGFHLHPMIWRRGSVNPMSFVMNIRAVRKLYSKLSPDLVHHVALQPTIVGSLAAVGLPCARLNALAGLGFVFTSASAKARLARPFLRALLRFGLGHERSAVLVQNPDDRAAVRNLGVADDKIFTIGGSGVDLNKLRPLPEAAGPITAAYIGRLLADKGLRALIKAHELLNRRGEPVTLLIAGKPDPANPASISDQEIASWARIPGVRLLGHVADIGDVWKVAHIAVLPSRREGLPKSLLEAAAYGRPIVATDVPGNREIARQGVNALLVPVDDPSALADAIARLARDRDLRRIFGEAGRKFVEERFSADRIGKEIVSLYDRLLDRASSTT